MHTMEEKRDTFAGVGWDKEIRNLGDPHVPFNPSPKRDIGVAKRYSDDYEENTFPQSTQA